MGANYQVVGQRGILPIRLTTAQKLAQEDLIMLYEYDDIADSPDTKQIHIDVGLSEMTDKNIEYCRWDEDTEILKVYWTDELSSGDKGLLDTIVANNS